ncbi:MAG: hypothetical protein AAGJ93_17570, partial [Bacteroidota bacterium]
MKKVLAVLLLSLSAALIWYLFIRPYDLQVRMKLKAKPGVITQLVKLWDKNDSNRKLIDPTEGAALAQEVKLGGHRYELYWFAEMINDSISQIKIRVTEPGNEVSNRIVSLLTESELEENAAKALKDFYQLAQGHLKKFKVTLNGIEEYPSTHCIYVPLATSQASKAHGMMANYSLLSAYIMENDLESAGVPFLLIPSIDHHKGY